MTTTPTSTKKSPKSGTAPDKTTVDLDSYLRVHRALRETAADLALAMSRTPSKAMRRWFNGFADEIRCHHHIEDELLFPALAERLATYDQYGPTLESDHEYLDRVLDQMRVAVAAAGSDGRADSRELAKLAADLSGHLEQHLAYEDTEIVPLFARHFTSDEFEQLNQRAIRMTPPKQLVFTAPWLMSRLSKSEQSAVLASAGKPLHLLWFLTRRRYARLVRRAFGP